MFRFAVVAASLLAAIVAMLSGVEALEMADETRTPARQPTATRSVEAAARAFRLQVYRTYRTDRDEFERRRAAAEQVHTAWRNAGKHADDEPAVIRWFEEAAYQSRAEIRGPLPEPPRFGHPDSVAQRKTPPHPLRPPAPLIKPHTPAHVASPHPSGTSQIVPRTQATAPRTSTILRRPMPGETSSSPTTQKSIIIRPDPTAAGNFGTPGAITDVDPPARLRGIARPYGATVHTAPSISTTPGNRATKLPQPGVQSAPMDRRQSSHAKAPEIDHRDLPEERPYSPAAQPRNANHGPAADPSNPALARPPQRVALAKPSLGGADRRVPELAAPTPIDVLPAPVKTEFNIGELLARAAGFGVGLRTIDSVLLDSDDLSTSELAELLAELELLLNQRRDLLLYESLVGHADRARLVRSLAFPQTTVAGLGNRIAKEREQLAARSATDSQQRNRELETLEALSLRLSRVVQE
jgi:hypothetical protein